MTIIISTNISLVKAVFKWWQKGCEIWREIAPKMEPWAAATTPYSNWCKFCTSKSIVLLHLWRNDLWALNLGFPNWVSIAQDEMVRILPTQEDRERKKNGGIFPPFLRNLQRERGDIYYRHIWFTATVPQWAKTRKKFILASKAKINVFLKKIFTPLAAFVSGTLR